ncbi:thiamine phosphate synthase [Alloacidobacterium dinghuense]|uniref:Thiamine phosphate synthase n=1 Tax=Alloacidobacterium dinghuense TaxID=2763107 RepID=A0A7G8BG04_9BACT|nr:thiamine phosphate synthase [Alloacidobacterium dinghuense]QNI31474.1 thiamine phosphate synthase [Alloacidobacterium dinghuense]
MQLYAITNRRLFARSEDLMKQVVLWASSGVEYVQIREKDLAMVDLAALAEGIVGAVRSVAASTRVLLNGPAEVAAATGCDGVHLTAGLPGLAIQDARLAMSRVVADPIISVSCHTLAEIEHARDDGAVLAIFAPVFEKRLESETMPGQGLEALAAACKVAAPIPVFALGGITAGNAESCVHAGATGIAAIRLFASSDWLSLRGSLSDPRG